MVLAKTDLAIHEDYARLAAPEVRDELLPAIRDEHERTVSVAAPAARSDRLLDHDPALREVLALRDPYLDPLHVIQVALLERLTVAGRSRGRTRGSSRTRSCSRPTASRLDCATPAEARVRRCRPAVDAQTSSVPCSR
jgi:phosphoenolpyruvate carboxylase